MLTFGKRPNLVSFIRVGAPASRPVLAVVHVADACMHPFGWEEKGNKVALITPCGKASLHEHAMRMEQVVKCA